MWFAFCMALRYLLPKWRQLSVSIISLVSVLVISLVVWLAIVFLSVSEGIEKKWQQELTTLSAPLRMTPTEEYYQSYYYQIDTLAEHSNYATKTLGEKLLSTETNPYNPAYDLELPLDFPSPDYNQEGSLKDLVKEGWSAISSLPSFFEAQAKEYEISFSNLQLELIRHVASPSFLTQVSYVTAYDEKNSNFTKTLLPPTSSDYTNWLRHVESHARTLPSLKEKLKTFFKTATVSSLKTPPAGYHLPPSLYPEKATWQGVALIEQAQIQKIFIPQKASSLKDLKERLTAKGEEVLTGSVVFKENKPQFYFNEHSLSSNPPLFLEENLFLKADIQKDSIDSLTSLKSLKFTIKDHIQEIPIEGDVFFDQLEVGKIKNASLPDLSFQEWGHGVLLPKSFAQKGALLGDRGFLSYYTHTATSMQEQRIPIYISGFYDPGLIPIGNRLVFASPQVLTMLRGNPTLSDSMLGNGIHIWIRDLQKAEKVKNIIHKTLKEKGIDRYWHVESFNDYEFSRPFLQQLKSDKVIFTLIAIIILIVACSNVISMLILLVNDKKKEIGILQSMGTSSTRIALIFGTCGCLTGFISSLLGVCVALFTLRYLHSLVGFLNFLQGREAFQAAFYGAQLPNEISLNALLFVFISTTLLSLIAGIAPAIKASKIRPAEILRSE